MGDSRSVCVVVDPGTRNLGLLFFDLAPPHPIVWWGIQDVVDYGSNAQCVGQGVITAILNIADAMGSRVDSVWLETQTVAVALMRYIEGAVAGFFYAREVPVHTYSAAWWRRSLRCALGSWAANKRAGVDVCEKEIAGSSLEDRWKTMWTMSSFTHKHNLADTFLPYWLFCGFFSHEECKEPPIPSARWRSKEERRKRRVQIPVSRRRSPDGPPSTTSDAPMQL